MKTLTQFLSSMVGSGKPEKSRTKRLSNRSTMHYDALEKRDLRAGLAGLESPELANAIPQSSEVAYQSVVVTTEMIERATQYHRQRFPNQVLPFMNPTNPVQTKLEGDILTIIGSNQADQIHVWQSPDSGKVNVRIKFQGSIYRQEFEADAISKVVIHGMAGDDVINLGGLEVDPVTKAPLNPLNIAAELYGGAGNDVLVGGQLADRIFGGEGNDWVKGLAGNDLIAGQDGNDRIFGGADHDEVYGNAGLDRIDGGSGSDRIWGGAGNDLLEGGEGNDRLNGGAGADLLLGQAGDDLIYGGDGNDRCRGGAGKDSFWCGNGWDLIEDLDTNEIGVLNGRDDVGLSVLSTLKFGQNRVGEFREPFGRSERESETNRTVPVWEIL